MKNPRIIIAGGGPVGVVSALACAQYGYAVTLLEAEDRIDDNPRAATTHPSTLELIARVGLIDQFIGEGLVARFFQFWDKPSRTKIVEFDHEFLRAETPYPFVVQTEQHKLAQMGIERLTTFPNATVRFSSRATTVNQDAEGATVTIEGPRGTETLRGEYVIGADGGRSTIRKALEIEFEGFTWPERFLVLTTIEDFQKLLTGCCYRNYLADPNEWTNLFKVAGDDGKGRWRAVFPTRVEESDEQALGDDSTYSRLQRVFPIDRPYNVVHRNLYKVHQRVANENGPKKILRVLQESVQDSGIVFAGTHLLPNPQTAQRKDTRFHSGKEKGQNRTEAHEKQEWQISVHRGSSPRFRATSTRISRTRTSVDVAPHPPPHPQPYPP